MYSHDWWGEGYNQGGDDGYENRAKNPCPPGHCPASEVPDFEAGYATGYEDGRIRRAEDDGGLRDA